MYPHFLVKLFDQIIICDKFYKVFGKVYNFWLKSKIELNSQPLKIFKIYGQLCYLLLVIFFEPVLHKTILLDEFTGLRVSYTLLLVNT